MSIYMSLLKKGRKKKREMITWLKEVWPQKRKPNFKKRNNVTSFFFLLKLCFTTFNLEPICKYEPNFQRDLIGIKLFTGLAQTYEHLLLICVHVCDTRVCICVCSASLRICIAHIIQKTRQSQFFYAYCIQLNSRNDQFIITSVMAL